MARTGSNSHSLPLTIFALRWAVLWTALVLLALVVIVGPAGATSRIKDIADFEGVRENQLVGYGLVVGLDGTGDDIKKKSPFTR